ncbi:MAG TPA: dienelactone hydrolase family protein [Terriglobales bacterium]|jgi:carboxymethylenebutenolidase
MHSVSQSQITFESGGKDIRMDCFVPEGGLERFPAVIGLHGSGGGYESMAEPAGMLARQGFAVYVLHYFDRTGDERVSDRGAILKNSPMWLKTIYDAMNYVEQQAGVDGKRIGLLGFSLGAYLALTIAAFDSRVLAVVEFFGGFPKEIKLFMKRLCPVLILHGDADPTVPVQEAYDLEELLKKKEMAYEMQIYPGAGHGFTGEVWQDAEFRTLDFFKHYL